MHEDFVRQGISPFKQKQCFIILRYRNIREKKKDFSGLRHNIPFSNVNDKEKSLFVSKEFYNQYDHM